ncbi:hypothetical protein CAC42_406 [Sphaceloma murrayae]|uniref:Uncharacterized protein n=1 Tax=Sphaceloma murrayae TaxID=2082308 RepID=A0A2K1R3F9_9PEZI|nr:hypothetical protein CAC42_406 [Sphaceloma murrayae]
MHTPTKTQTVLALADYKTMRATKTRMTPSTSPTPTPPRPTSPSTSPQESGPTTPNPRPTPPSSPCSVRRYIDDEASGPGFTTAEKGKQSQENRGTEWSGKTKKTGMAKFMAKLKREKGGYCRAVREGRRSATRTGTVQGGGGVVKSRAKTGPKMVPGQEKRWSVKGVTRREEEMEREIEAAKRAFRSEQRGRPGIVVGRDQAVSLS